MINDYKIGIALGLLILIVGIGFFLFSRLSNQNDILGERNHSLQLSLLEKADQPQRFADQQQVGVHPGKPLQPVGTIPFLQSLFVP